MSKVNTGQASSTLIPKYIGSDFDKVVAVADNIEQVVIVGDNIEDVGTVADNINYVKEVAEDLHGMPVTMYTGENPPVLNPMPEGVMWYCTTDGRTYVWYTDADSGQWVESAPQSAMKDEATNIFFHSVPSNVHPAYRSATLHGTPSPEAEISVAHNALNTPVVQAQFIREEALWVDVSVTGAQGIVTLMGYSSGNSQLKAEIITWKNGAEGTSLGTSQWVTLPSQPSVVSLPVTLANIDVLDAGDSYVVRLTSQMNAGGSAVSTILVDGNTSSRFGIIFNTNLIGLNDGIRDGVTTSAPTENAVYDALQLKVGKSQLIQSGNLTSTANWANVPAYSDSELGGSGGPLNAQAKALTARSELLLTDVREALRRSYAEAGFNLVDGSFEAGGVLVNANDVLLQERTGKAFSGPAGTVAAGTNPASGGFTDRSFAPNYFKQNAISAVTRSALDKMRDVVHVADFGAIGDGTTDNTAAIQAALDYAFTSKSKLQFGPGVYRVTNTLNAMLGDNYSTPGTFMFGAGKGKTIILLDYNNTASPKSVIKLVKGPTATDSIYNFSCYDMNLRGTVTDAVSAGVEVGIGVSGLDFRNVEIRKVIAGVWMRTNAWINSFTGMTISPRDYGIRMDNSGTTNWFDGCFVYGSNVTAYKLRSSYSSIGSLAADNCIGTIYDLRFFSGSVGSLGAESPVVGRTPSKLLMVDNGNVDIKYIHGFRVCPTDGTSFIGVEVGAGNVRIGTIILDQHNQSDANLVVTGSVIKGYRGSVKLGGVYTPKDSNTVNPGTLTFSAPDPQSTFIQLDLADGTPTAMNGDSKPFMGIGRSEATALSGITQSLPLRTQQNIYLDAAGGPRGSGVGANYNAARDHYKSGATQGSWMMEVDPGLRGCAGYAVTVGGIDMASTSVLRIPVRENVVALVNLPTTDLWEGRRVWLKSTHKWVTYSAYGTAGWYDETGTKVA